MADRRVHAVTPANAGKTYPAEALSRDEIERILAACPSHAIGARNAALIATMWRAGLRSFEACALRRADWKEGTLTVLRPKGAALGKRPRVVAVDRVLAGYLRAWDARGLAKDGLDRDLRLEDIDPLFPTQSGGRVATSYLRALLPRLATLAGITRRVHPHALRHTFAFEMSMEGMALPVIQGALGHSNPLVTSLYISHLAPSQVIDAMKERQ